MFVDKTSRRRGGGGSLSVRRHARLKNFLKYRRPSPRIHVGRDLLYSAGSHNRKTVTRGPSTFFFAFFFFFFSFSLLAPPSRELCKNPRREKHPDRVRGGSVQSSGAKHRSCIIKSAFDPPVCLMHDASRLLAVSKSIREEKSGRVLPSRRGELGRSSF